MRYKTIQWCVCFLVFLVTMIPSSLWAKKTKDSKPFMLLSPAFENNNDIPSKHTCKGPGINPDLEIYNPPAKTKSYVISLQDSDALAGPWTHWAVYNIPVQKVSIAEDSIPGSEVLNDFGKYSYVGPCSEDDRTHHFVFTVYALKTVLTINETWTLHDLEKSMRGHVLAQSQLIGRDQR